MAPCSKRNEKKNSNNNPTEYTPRKTRITVAHCYLDYVTNDYLFGTRNLNHIFLFQFPSLIFFFSLAPLFCMYDRVCVCVCVCVRVCVLLLVGIFRLRARNGKWRAFFQAKQIKNVAFLFHICFVLYMYLCAWLCVCPYTDTDVSIADMGVLVCV